MNLGGRRITNDDLRAEFEALGYGSVTPFRASGNVIFAAAGQAEDALVAAIEEGLRESLGYAVPTFIRDARAVRGIAGFDPFDPDVVARSKGKLQVALLPRKPPASGGRQVLEFATDDDRLALAGRELYWLPGGGVSDSELDLNEVERLVGPLTIRTMGTIEGIAAKLPPHG